MAEKAVAPVPCLRSHDLSRFQPPAKDQVPGDEEILRLVQQMPTLLYPYEEMEAAEGEAATAVATKGVGCKSFRLVVPPDVDPASVASLEPSWFVNIVVTITDRNGCVIYHEAHFPKNPSLREGIKNFVDVRWGDFVHPPDADIWTFAEADRWRAVRLAASQSPPPPLTTTENGNGGGSSNGGSRGQRRRRRVSSGGGASQPQQQVVSTTSRLSPDIADSATEGALLRRFVLSPLYRARWGGLDDVFYFRTISLPFLRNQGGSDGSLDDKTMVSITTESTNVFSPTSSFENLLLLSYHCILGKVPEDALSEAVGTGETTVFDTVTLRVAQKPTDLALLKSTIAPTAFPVSATTAISSASPIEHLARVFCFDNLLLARSEGGGDAKFWSVSQSREFYHHHHSSCYRQQEDRSTDAYRFSEPPKTQQASLPAGSRPASYSSAHLAPVDIDWIDQSQPPGHPHQQRQQQPHYSGMPQVTSTVVRAPATALPASSQKEGTITTKDFQQRFRGPTSTSETPESPSPTRPPEVNKATSQHDRISIFLSLLLPEAIREIKEAVSAEPDMVAQRVRAIVTRHLGPEILSKFFSNPQQPSATTTNAAAPPPFLPPPPIPTSSTSSAAVTSSPVATARRAAIVPSEAGCCGNTRVDGNGRVASTTAAVLSASSQLSVAPLLLKESPTGLLPPLQSKRPSLVQELSVTSDIDPPPPPVFCSSTPGRKDLSPLCSVSCGPKPRTVVMVPTPSAQTSGTTTPASFDSMAGSSPWMAVTRGSQQAAPSLPPSSKSLPLSVEPASSLRKHTTASSSSSSSNSSQEVHSTAGVLESLLMGGYVAPDSRLRRISGSSVATTITTATISNLVRHRNASEATLVTTGGGVSECRQVLSSSGPSSTCCQAPKVSSSFSFDGEEWPMVTSTVSGSSSSNSPTTGNRAGALNSTPQLLMSPNSSSSCSSLAHLLRHGCPPASVTSVNSAITTAVTTAPTTTTVTAAAASEPLSSPILPTACAARASRLAASAAATVGMPKTAPSRPLDCPLSIIIDPQPSSGVKSATHLPPSYEDGLSPKTEGPPSSKLPLLAPQPKDSLFLLHEVPNNNSISNPQRQSNPSGGSSGGIARKTNIRDTSEDEDAALANSSLCRLLQGPDPRWETVTAEVDATAQEDAPVAPPPPPPSFFELPSDVLVVSSGGSGGEVRRTRYDSCPMALRQPLSVPAPSQVGVASVPPPQSVTSPTATSVVAKGSSGECVVVGSGANGGSCCRGSSSSAPPSAVNAMDASSSSPINIERNRRAAAAAAAQIAEEAEHQRRQRPSSRHLLERQRLLFQQNVGQVTTYGSGSHSLLEPTLSHHHQQRRQQQQTPLNCGFISSGGDVLSTSSGASCCHIQAMGGEGFCELDAALLTPNPVAPAAQAQSLVSQRTPLEDFSRRMKEIAPNVRVSPTGYHHHFPVSSLYSPDHQQQPQMSQVQPVYEYSGGHLAPVNYEYQDHQQTASSSQGLLTGTSPQYENPALGPPPPYSSHLPSIQPKFLSHHHNLQQHPHSHHPHQYQHHQQQQQLQRQNQQSYYHAQSHPHHQQQQQLLYHQQRSSVPQPPSPQVLCGSEAYASSPSMAYFDPQFSFQQQHQMLMQQPPPPPSRPPNYPSPLSLALQQSQPLPHSQVKASLREKVTSRCQAENVDIMATGSSPPPPPPLSASIAPHSTGSAAPAVIGQKRPHPSDGLNSGIGNGGNEYFYGPPPPHPPSPPHYHQTFEQVSSEMDLPFLDDSTYGSYELSQQQAPLPTQPPSPSQQRFAERQSSMLFEEQQYAPVCDCNSIANTSAITAANDTTDSSNKWKPSYDHRPFGGLGRSVFPSQVSLVVSSSPRATT
ncbi:hypothetical protein ECG_04882 [Echinococcus granulosus]|nr:hypothetical protein ECG_04882 [Echinococcus granulosus]